MFEEVNDGIIGEDGHVETANPFFFTIVLGLDDSAGNLWKFAQGCQINASAGSSLMILQFISNEEGAGDRNDVDQQMIIVEQC